MEGLSPSSRKLDGSRMWPLIQAAERPDARSFPMPFMTRSGARSSSRASFNSRSVRAVSSAFACYEAFGTSMSRMSKIDQLVALARLWWACETVLPW